MPDITKLLTSGTNDHRVDLVFVAEGYQGFERGKFLLDSAQFLDAILGSSNATLNQPFSAYRSYFNASALFVASNQSGVDGPGVTVDTYFDGQQVGADGRLIYGDDQKVKKVVSAAYADNAHEMTVVLVNSSVYGGSGGGTSWATTGNIFSSELVLHEIGHSFAGLSDEYVDESAIANFPLSELNSSNVTNSLNHIPWSAWLGYTDALGTVGAYEGGYYRTTGVWRATPDSKMLHLGVPFSAPEKEAFSLAYYKAIGDYLSIKVPLPGLVSADVPDTSLLAYSWTVDGKTALWSNSAYLDLYGQGATTHAANVKLSTVDNTGTIRAGLSTTSQTELATIPSVAVVDVSQKVYQLAQSQTIYRFGADDNQISVGGGIANDYVDGGMGRDTLTLSGALSSYQKMGLSTGTFLLGRQDAPVFAVKNVERLQFDDVKLALDSDAGTAAKLLGAVFGKQTVLFKDYVGIVLSYLDGGMSHSDLMQKAIDVRFGLTPNNANVVETIYTNVVGVEPTIETTASFVDLLDRGAYTPASLALFASDTDLNALNINLVGLTSTGLAYV